MTTRTDTKAVAQPLPCVMIGLGRLIERRTNKTLRIHGLTAGQFMVLDLIGGRPGASRAGLGRGLQVTPQAVGGLAAQLAERDLIRKTTSTRGRPVEFTITTSGRELLDRVERPLEELSTELLQFFRPNLAAVLDGGLRHLLMRMSTA